jgi:hypothetical protein
MGALQAWIGHGSWRHMLNVILWSVFSGNNIQHGDDMGRTSEVGYGIVDYELHETFCAEGYSFSQEKCLLLELSSWFVVL